MKFVSLITYSSKYDFYISFIIGIPIHLSKNCKAKLGSIFKDFIKLFSDSI